MQGSRFKLCKSMKERPHTAHPGSLCHPLPAHPDPHPAMFANTQVPRGHVRACMSTSVPTPGKSFSGSPLDTRRTARRAPQRSVLAGVQCSRVICTRISPRVLAVRNWGAHSGGVCKHGACLQLPSMRARTSLRRALYRACSIQSLGHCAAACPPASSTKSTASASTVSTEESLSSSLAPVLPGMACGVCPACGCAHDEHRPGLPGPTCRAQPVRCLAGPAARRWAGARTGAADRGRCTERAALPVGEDTGLRRMDPVDFVGEGGSGRFDMDSGVWGLCACVSRACPQG
jgi:hypothetical protein